VNYRWHVLHFPFQFLCVALSMDTAESLALVEDSMIALRTLQQYFPTKRVQTSVKMAEHLIRMCQKKKLDAAQILGQSTQDMLGSREYLGTGTGETVSQAPILPADNLAAVQGNETDIPIVPAETEQMGLDLVSWEKFFSSDFAFDLGLSDPYCLPNTEEIM
jgi:hypothetical protein